MSDVVRLYATAPARRYRLPKGEVTPGADADIVLVDPEGSWTVKDEDILSKAGWSPFSGHSFKGEIVGTYLRGSAVAVQGVPLDDRTGQFVRPVL